MINLLLLLIVFCILYALFYKMLPGTFGGMIDDMRNIWCKNIELSTLDNNNYRKVEHTTQNMQLVVMKLKPGEEIGMERHPSTTQFIRVEKGEGIAIVNGHEFFLGNNSAIIIPPNTLHNIKNTSKDELKLYTIYTPPEHSPTLVQPIKHD